MSSAELRFSVRTTTFPRVLRLTVQRVDGLVGDVETSVNVRVVRGEGDCGLVVLHRLHHMPRLLPAQPGVDRHMKLTD